METREGNKYTEGHPIKDVNAYVSFIIYTSINTLRRNVGALEAVVKGDEFKEEVNAMYAAIDRLKRAEK